MRILCFINLHSWKRLPNQLGDCGMGSEWFECWECRRCMTIYDRVRSGKKGWSPLKHTNLRGRK